MNYKDYIGRDITSLVTLPVWIMEPYTMLQKVAEIMEYTEQLDRAAGSPVDLFVNGTLIARGEVVVVDEEFGVRVSEIVSSDGSNDSTRA